MLVRPKVLLMAVVALVAFPDCAWANSALPSWYATPLHLFFGNIILGLLEGLAVALLTRQRVGFCVPVMIAANYFSSWFGGVCIGRAIIHLAQPDIYSGWRWFWVMAVVAYLLTLVLEWPFAASIIRKRTDWLRRSIIVTLLVQTVSCAGLFWYYWATHHQNLYSSVRVVPLAEMSVPRGIEVFFVEATGSAVCVLDLDNLSVRKVATLPSFELLNRLETQLSRSASNRCDLCAALALPGDELVSWPVVLPSFKPVEAVAWREDPVTLQIVSMVEALPLGVAKGSQWRFNLWGRDGMMVVDTRTESRTEFAWFTPYMPWRMHNGTHLPDDSLVFQLGDDQICLFHPEPRQMALLTRGRCPLATLKTE